MLPEIATLQNAAIQENLKTDCKALGVTLNLIYSDLFISDRNNKKLTRDLNRCCRLMDSPTEEVGLRLFLRTLPDMIRDE